MKTCISTRFDRDNILFDLWIKNSLNYKLDIVIFIDSHDQKIYDKIDQINKLSKNKITTVDVTEFGNIYEIKNINFFIKIFDILYEQMGYENVIYTDPDELILCNNINKFIDSDFNFLVSRGFEIFQDKSEKEYDINVNFLDQRNFGFWSDEGHTKSSPYNKFFLFRKDKYRYPQSQGRHASEGKEFPTFIKKDFVVLLHIKEICKKLNLLNSQFNWEKYRNNHPHHNLMDIEEAEKRLEEWFYPHKSEIPEKIKKIIFKNGL